MGHCLKPRGQTSVEYLMLLAVAFIAAYIMIRGPIGNFTRALLENINSGIQNLVSHAEWSSEELEPFRGAHPSSESRLSPLHL